MAAEHIIAFPSDCPRYETCVQESRISKLEQRADNGKAQLDRIETTVNKILWWIVGFAVTIAGGALAAAVTIAIHLIR